MSDITSVAVLGTGTIGASWAALFAVNGRQVTLYDDHADCLARGLDQTRAHLARLVELGLAETVEADLRVAESLEELVAGAQFVQESVVETYAVKKPLFARLDALTSPDTIIASSSSGLLVSDLQSVMNRPERVLIAHPFNPPHLVPLVELVAGPATSPDVIAAAKTFFTALGKVPVVLNKEVPGHIANRLACALWREAIDLVARGVATVEDVDKALCAGPGLRWAIMGQHMIYHLGGGAGGYEYFIDHIGKAFEAYWRDMADWTAIPEDAKRQVVAGVQDALAGRDTAAIARHRDEKLAELLKVLYRQ